MGERESLDRWTRQEAGWMPSMNSDESVRLEVFEWFQSAGNHHPPERKDSTFSLLPVFIDIHFLPKHSFHRDLLIPSINLPPINALSPTSLLSSPSLSTITLQDDVHKEFQNFNIAQKPTVRLRRLGVDIILTSFAPG